MSTSLIGRGSTIDTVNPWRVFDEMERQMWDWMSTPSHLTPLNRLVNNSTAYVPPIDVYETSEDVLVAASLPGIDSKQVDVQVHDTTVTVSGEQLPVFSPAEGTAYRQHLAGIRPLGKFSFRFSLPVEVLSEQAQAVYQDGMLRLRFPKAPSAKPTRIEVNAGSSPQTIETKTPDQIEAKTDNTNRRK